jgi:hypothetical protein
MIVQYLAFICAFCVICGVLQVSVVGDEMGTRVMRGG